MKNVCRYCGAVINEGAKICTNCGKVVAPTSKTVQQSDSQFSNFSGSQGITPGFSDKARVNSSASRSAKQMNYTDGNYSRTVNRGTSSGYDPVKHAQQKIPFVTNESSGKQKHRSKLMPIVGTAVKILIVIFIIYVVFSFLAVTLVRRAGYDFNLDSSMTLECSTYGEAFDNYFKESKWRFSLKQMKVTFEGTSQDGEFYEITFGKTDGQTVVKTMTIDGEVIISDKIMDNYVMGMFMTTQS